MTTSRIRDVFIVIVIRLYYVFTKLRMYSREEAHSVSYIYFTKQQPQIGCYTCNSLMEIFFMYPFYLCNYIPYITILASV